MSAAVELIGPGRSVARPSARLGRGGGGSPVRLQGLRKAYGPSAVLHDLDLAVAPGEFVAIVGRSGCGKTTLLRLLAGLETADSGSIELGREPVTRLMFQDARLLPWRRVVDNVSIGRRDPTRGAAAMAALARVGLEGKARDWPATLSGGQRQRVALARALVSHPTLLLLDEPLGALDALTRLEMQELIEQVHTDQGFTGVLVTHDVGEAVQLADRVVVLDRGVIGGVWEIATPRPRPRGDPALSRIGAEILARLLEGR
jgi:sulfonate transport system ATP-binding protein